MTSAWLAAALAFALSFAGALFPVDKAQAAACPTGWTYSAPNCTRTYSFTGGTQTWTAPTGLTSATIVLNGAQGGNAGGNGGRVSATLAVTGGATYTLVVGGQGATGANAAGGYNGGGNAGGSYSNEGAGGGATDIRLADGTRIAIAGGGGGKGGWAGGGGGAGGGLTGGNGIAGQGGAGLGGTQSAGGSGGAGNGATSGTAGSQFQGGVGGSGAAAGGGGGGGGYFGGGGGGGDVDGCCADGGGGGGGSSFTNATYFSAVTHTQGANTGNGSITITHIGGPSIDSITTPTTTTTYTNQTAVDFVFNFSMPVANFIASDVVISGTSGSSGTWTRTLTGSGAGPWTLRVENANPIDGTLIATLDAANVTDASGYSGNGSQSLTVNIDRTAPTLSSFNFGASNYTTTSPSLSAVFSEPVSGLATNNVVLTGTSGTSGTWTRTLTTNTTSNYTIALANPAAISGQVSAQLQIGQIIDRAGNPLAAASSVVNTNLSLQPGISVGTLNNFGGAPNVVAPSAVIYDRGGSSVFAIRASIVQQSNSTFVTGDTLTFTNVDSTAFGSIQSATSTNGVLNLT